MPTTSQQLEPTVIEQQTLEIFRELLNELGSHQAAETVALHSSMDRDLGLGSLERVELLVRFEARFNTRLPDEVAQTAETPADWVRAVLDGRQESRQKARYKIVQPEREAPPPPETAKTIVEVLRRHAEVEPDRVHVHLLEDDSGQDITYRQLLETATHVATGLMTWGLKRNETVAIMLPTCADFFYSFLGIELAGGVPVPIYPPARPDKIEEYVRRQVAILRNAEVRFLISFDRIKSISKIMQVSIPSLREATTVDALRQRGMDAGGRVTPASVEPSEIGTLQYTSGSTGDPKGVVLSQANLLANIRGIGWAVQVRPTDVGVSWLPLYHDMGLIGSWLFCLYYAVPLTVLSPLAFLSRPERWLWALHDSGGTLCPAPNFSYELCARKIPEKSLQGLDLSRWRIAINAGEPVLPDTLAHFTQRFAPYGFHPESYVPCYGLAESSVALAFPGIDRVPVIDSIRRDLFESEGKAVPVEGADVDEANVMRFIANGKPLPGHEIRIVDGENQKVGERQQGRLFFRGPSRTSGYYRNPKATAAIMTEDGWMDSGDLAYWAGGEVYVTGRIKDCIIKSGRNIIPQEVEMATADVPGVRRGCVAAFGTVDPDSGTERLVVVAETRTTDGKELDRIKAEITRNVDAALGIPPDRVELVAPHSIPKTSSGKIRRNETRLLFLSGKLDAGKRAPWVQLVRLWLGNFGSWVSLRLGHFGGWVRRTYSSGLMWATAASVGVLVRVIPGTKAAAQIIQWAARTILWWTGHGVEIQGAERLNGNGPEVLIANRAGRVDPLVLAATLRSPFLIADAAILAPLPREARFLLKPLVASPVKGNAMPPGGTMQQRIRQGLEAGHSVLVLADGPPGVPSNLSRFRMDSFHAASETGAPVQPIGVLGTSHILEPVRRTEPRAEARILVGQPIRLAMANGNGITAAREQVREALAELCDKKLKIKN
ncbi:MAG TPA: AMP-binding protein [Terriglobia bacterium]|nr:AMP-binding protein [Terriglobia bacterium]